jgi:DNA polymerase-1
MTSGIHDKKLFLLDAFALIYRAHFAFAKNPRYNSKGLNTSAILGFTNTLLEVLHKEKPTHIAVVFDAPVQTLREIDYNAYKANREEMPEDLRTAIPYIKQVIEGFNIPMLLADGYEADDVIGTLAKKAEQAGFITYMMTPDKDFGQLVSENILIYKPGRGGDPAQILGVKEVCEKFEVTHPEQVIEILGLWGDSVDNIPGIPGIGEKTAKILIKQYGTVENLIAHAHELKGKQQENVINFAEQGLMSKQLATILLDAPVEFDPESLKLDAPNKELLTNLFSELEFRTMAKRLFGEEVTLKQQVTTTTATSNGQMDMFGAADNQSETQSENESESEVQSSELVELKTIENTPHNYQFVDTADKRAALINTLLSASHVAFDTETTGLDQHEADLVGMSFSHKKNEGFYLPVPSNYDEAKAIVQAFKPFFESNTIVKIAHNFKYDYAVLSRYGVEINAPFTDTMIMHYLLQPDMNHGMDFLSETYLQYQPVSIESLIGKKGKNQQSMLDLDPERISDYAAEDADITLQLYHLFQQDIEQQATLKHLLNDIELPLTKVLAKMEREGICLDVNALKEFSKELETDLNALQKTIIELAGTEFNIDSPKQLGDVLFEYMKIDAKVKKTKTGQYSTNEETLLKIQDKHEIIGKILEYRSLKKLKSTYVDALPELVSAKTKRIHTNYMQTVAATGRLSSTNPNLQNIPIRSEKGREIRKAFIPRDSEHIIMAADYSQIELRVIAALSQDESMLGAFNNGEDIHAATAAKVFDVPLTEVSRDMRSKAKTVNFGIIYGISAFGLSQRINISRTEAKDIIEAYFEKYPKIKQYMDTNINFAREHGYVETIMKRRRYLNDINSANAVMRGYAERNAINAPIQGSAADIIKVAMINIQRELEQQHFQSKMLLQVHDELLFDAKKDELEKLKVVVQYQMENAVKLSVPLTVEVGVGENWLEAH